MRSVEILIFLFIIGFLFFNWPMLQIASKDVVAYLFIFWLIFIICVALAVMRKQKE